MKTEVLSAFLKVTEAAEILKLSRSGVYSLMDSGALGYAKFGKSRRISADELRAFVDRNTVSRGAK